MSAKKICRKEARLPITRAMDVTMIATTVGSAAIANMIFPSLGSAIIGAVLGAIIGFRATKSA
jgi:NhaP-type Na+/H+ or K+/H+ antiporter